MMNFQIPCNEIQIFRNEIKAGRIRRNKIQIQTSDFLRRIEPYQGVTPTPTAFFLFCTATRPQRRDASIGLACSLRVFLVPLSRFGVFRSFE
jgi:hypothetical protein